MSKILALHNHMGRVYTNGWKFGESRVINPKDPEFKADISKGWIRKIKDVPEEPALVTASIRVRDGGRNR